MATPARPVEDVEDQNESDEDEDEYEEAHDGLSAFAHISLRWGRGLIVGIRLFDDRESKYSPKGLYSLLVVCQVRSLYIVNVENKNLLHQTLHGVILKKGVTNGLI